MMMNDDGDAVWRSVRWLLPIRFCKKHDLVQQLHFKVLMMTVMMMMMIDMTTNLKPQWQVMNAPLNLRQTKNRLLDVY